MLETLILVDEEDRTIGSAEKMEAHRSGTLHRAFSVFVFHSDGRLLLQQRALGKYHSGGLWSNTCCGHPRWGEDLEAAATRRLGEEMGISCPLHRAFSFLYRADLGNGLVEHELDHVLIGRFDQDPNPAPEEAMAWRWVLPDTLLRELEEGPEAFTFWFRLCIDRALAVPE